MTHRYDAPLKYHLLQPETFIDPSSNGRELGNVRVRVRVCVCERERERDRERDREKERERGREREIVP